ncbi:MAG: hypothetical protein WD009_13170 [Phycisphaeraceae bacterium]
MHGCDATPDSDAGAQPEPRPWLRLLAAAEQAGDANLGQTLIRLARRAAELDAAAPPRVVHGEARR